MLNEQSNPTSGEIYQISQVDFLFTFCTSEIFETVSDQDMELIWMIDI